MTQAKKKIILLTTSLILTICLMAFFGVYALTTLKNSTFNVGVKYEPEYLVKVEMGIDGANGGTVNQTIEENEYVEIFNSLNPVSNGMYIDSMSNETIHINSQTLTPIGANGDVYFRITSLENETSGNKDLQCIINCGSSTADSGKLVIDTPQILTIATGINATSGTVTSSSLGMIKINLKFSEFILDFVDLKNLVSNSSAGLDFGELGIVTSSDITGKTFYVSNIDGLLNLSALVGKVNTTTTEYGPNYGYDNSAGPAITFSGATIQMLNDIDCENGDNKDNFSKTFIPIGYYNFGDIENSFQGTFDGNNKSINGLYVNATEEIRLSGLFGYALNAEIKNLKMINCKIIAEMAGGSIVAHAPGSMNINNCSSENTYISGTVESSILGGIAGRVDVLNVEDCYNTGNIIGGDDVGGIVGNVSVTTITNCYNTGSVGGNYYVGGIVGRVWETGTIANCYNTGSVSGSYNVGGIVGEVGYAEATITNCYNEGSVSGASDSVGGIVGFVKITATITNCYNTGSVSGDYNFGVGGIVGFANGTTTIANCYNTGSVSGSSSVGGIVGGVALDGGATITNCYNTGDVSGSNYVGGIVGGVALDGGATITNCYYLKTSSVNAGLNGVGHNDGTLDVNSYYGTFGEDQEVEIEDGRSLPTELSSYSNLKDLLNAWVNINKETNPNLKNWQKDEENIINNGYPFFVKE